MKQEVFHPKKSDFEGQIPNHKTTLITLKNNQNSTLHLTNYGARIVGFITLDQAHQEKDVVLGFKTLNNYLNADEQYHGATIGRYANRIADGKFCINNIEYSLDQNNPPNSLHGGINGFHKQVWNIEYLSENKVIFSYYSKNGEEGFPGNLKVLAIYQLSHNNEIIIEYKAVTDQETVINITNHAFFNLHGEGNGTTLNHFLKIPTQEFFPCNNFQIPNHKTVVENTIFDFQNWTKIEDIIDFNDPQLKITKGYDHTFINNKPIDEIAAAAYSEETGILLEVFTTEPSVHLYTGNWLNGNDIGKNDNPYTEFSAICLETQHYPDSPNRLDFPSVFLKPEEEYYTKTIFRFSIKK